MLTNINHLNNQSTYLKYTGRAVATPPCGNVGKPSARFSCFFMETIDLFNQPAQETIEIWKDVPEYSGFYQASSLGNIRSIDRTIKRSDGKICNFKGQIIKKHLTEFGYLHLRLTINGNGKTVLVHQVIAKTFLDNPNNLCVINHKNGIKTDNRIENIEWCTASYNLSHALSTGLKSNKGIKNPRAKISEEDVINMRDDFKKGLSYRDLSKKYNSSYENSILIITRKTWKHLL